MTTYKFYERTQEGVVTVATLERSGLVTEKLSGPDADMIQRLLDSTGYKPGLDPTFFVHGGYLFCDLVDETKQHHKGPGDHPSGSSQDVHNPHKSGGSRGPVKAPKGIPPDADAMERLRFTAEHKERMRREYAKLAKIQPPLPGFKGYDKRLDEIADPRELFIDDLDKTFEEHKARMEDHRKRAQERLELLTKSEGVDFNESNAYGEKDFYKSVVSRHVDEVEEVWRESFYEPDLAWKEDDPFDVISSAFDFQDMDSEIESKVLEVSVDGGKIKVVGVFSDEWGEFPETAERENAFLAHLEPDGGVYYDWVVVPQELQGTGFGSRWFENTETTAIKAGASYSHLNANITVGGYAWARMGFDFADGFEVAGISNSTSGELEPLYLEKWDEWYSIAADAHYESTKEILPYFQPPKINHAWELAALEHPYADYVYDSGQYNEYGFGKEVMLGSDWNAYKELTPSAESAIVGELYYEFKN